MKLVKRPMKEYVIAIVFILILFVVISAIVSAFIRDINAEKELKKVLEEECRKKGHENLTNFKRLVRQDNRETLFHILCDEQHMYKSIPCERVHECKYDKWGDCSPKFLDTYICNSS